jgi:hypothetical protein
MNRKLYPLILSGLSVVAAYQAFADDSPNTSANKDQQMKDCMAKQKATNSGMTQTAMETVCKNQIEKQQKDGNDLATGPQANKPHN